MPNDMRLAQLEINYVRNLVGVCIECSPGINCLYEENAAGKTAILGAIYLLARARSFRTPRVGDVIQHSRESLTVAAQLVDDNERDVITGLEKSAESTWIRFNGTKISRRPEQAMNIPLLLITPDSQRLLVGAPQGKEDTGWTGLCSTWNLVILKTGSFIIRRYGTEMHYFGGGVKTRSSIFGKMRWLMQQKN